MKTARIDFKKIGNHWYPCIDHIDPNDISLDPKLERYLNTLSIIENDIITFYFQELGDIVDYDYLLQFEESDVTRFLTTDDDFEMICYIGNHQFYISSNLYSLLEEIYNFNFHKNLYRIEIEWY